MLDKNLSTIVKRVVPFLLLFGIIYWLVLNQYTCSSPRHCSKYFIKIDLLAIVASTGSLLFWRLRREDCLSTGVPAWAT
jgi:hypothetical protein